MSKRSAYQARRAPGGTPLGSQYFVNASSAHEQVPTRICAAIPARIREDGARREAPSCRRFSASLARLGREERAGAEGARRGLAAARNTGQRGCRTGCESLDLDRNRVEHGPSRELLAERERAVGLGPHVL